MFTVQTIVRRSLHPAVPPVLHRSRAQEVYEQLKRDVADFKLVPGDRFTENELSERLGVSRTPVRQALFRMQQEGYVEVLFRSGWRVLPFDFDQFEQLYDLRMVLETTAVRRLCERVPMPDLDELRAVWLVPADERIQDGRRVSLLDERFHVALVEAGGNAEMARVHRDVTERIRIMRRLDFTQDERVRNTYAEHAQILRAILRRRADQAILLLGAHVETSKSEVRKITLHKLQTSLPAAMA